MGYSESDELVTSYVFIVLNTIFISLRVFTKARYSKGQLGCDDVLAIVAYILCVGVCGICVAFAYVGKREGLEAAAAAAAHSHAPPTALLAWLKLLFALECVYTFAIAFSKLAILALYRRIFTRASTLLAIRIMIGMVVANAIAYQIAILCQCTPFSGVFSASPDAKCINKQALSRSASVSGLAVDIPILLLPLPSIYRMNATTMRKIGILLVFGVGCLGIATCVVRTVVFFSHVINNNIAQSPYILAGISAIEPSMYMISGCLMTLRPLVARVFRVLASHRKASRKTDSRSSYYPYPTEQTQSYQHPAGEAPNDDDADDVEGIAAQETGERHGDEELHQKEGSIEVAEKEKSGDSDDDYGSWFGSSSSA